MSKAKKYDQEKAPMSLLAPDVLMAVAEVMGFGAKKYSANNWSSGDGFDHSRLLSGALRHIMQYEMGIDLDDESNLSHIDHAICNLMFLSAHIKRNLGTDDRDPSFNNKKGNK